MDEDGLVAVDEEGNEMVVNDTYLRGEFPPPGKSKSRRIGDTPADRFHNAKVALATAMDGVSAAFEALGLVVGDDGRPMVEVKGVDARDCKAWRELIGAMDEEFIVWARTFRRVLGVRAARPEPSASDRDENESGESPDVGEFVDLESA